MKKAFAPLVLLAAFALAVPVSASQNAGYKDKFDSIGWGGSNGSLSWSGPWAEINDDNDEKFGNVRVVSSGNCASGICMSFSALTTLLGPIGARRGADTSAFDSLELGFDLKATASLLNSELLVQVTNGNGWVTVADYELGSAQTDHPSIDISEFRSEDFSVRFQFSGVLLSSDVFIDNVEISGQLREETTTTTAPSPTTTTQGEGGQATTSTTRPSSSTTTTVRSTTTTKATSDSTSPDSGSSTSTTVAEITTTSGDSGSAVIALGGSDEEQPPGPGGSIGRGGIRQAARGLQADFDGSLFGQFTAISPITGVDFRARFSLAVEMIEASWVWMVLLALVIAWSIVSGMERRRNQLFD